MTLDSPLAHIFLFLYSRAKEKDTILKVIEEEEETPTEW